MAVVLSVNVASVGTLRHRGRDIATAIHKRPQAGRLPVRELGLAGDAQADARFHGGASQALCVFPTEHSAAFARELGIDLPAGAFGENLTVAGMTEADACVGDIYELGTALVEVSAPRTPCYKPGAAHGAHRLKNLMKDTGRVGWYLRVLQPGDIGAGDLFELCARPWPELTVEAVFAARRERDPERIALALTAPQLAERYAGDLRARLDAVTA